MAYTIYIFTESKLPENIKQKLTTSQNIFMVTLSICLVLIVVVTISNYLWNKKLVNLIHIILYKGQSFKTLNPTTIIC